GAVYVIYGSPQVPGATIDLLNPGASGIRVSTIYGENNLDCAGDSVRAFDINNDGMAELFVGNPEHTFMINGEMRFDAGDTKLIFGRPDFLPEVIKLYALPAGLRVFRLAGAGSGDEFSYRLAGGDVDGDGFIDFISNAMHGDGFNNRLFNAGEVYVFSGRKLSAKLGMLGGGPAPGLEIQSATLLVGGQPVTQANAGQSGIEIRIDGTGFRADTEVLINGAPVISHIPSDAQLATRRTVSLDENLTVRNTAGPLRVRVRNTNPPSSESNEVIAGTLVGPEITSLKVKRKRSGVLILKINGSRFQQGMAVTVTREGGQQVPLTSSFVSSDRLKVKIEASAAPAQGSTIRVRAVTSSGVQTNELVVTLSK
ncbi:MAG TPA: FG-GAP repeat protein, partial [Blastocatellia bacterium]|nr:FG-GAP repeat protein [Blastocatellia bacterium]